MKKLLTLVLAFVALASIVSCGKDDAKPLNIEIDGDDVAGILNAYVIDEGTTCSQCKSDGIGDVKLTTFVLTDGEFTFGTDGFIDGFVDGARYTWIELRTYSLNDTFEPGAFDIWDWWCGGNTYNGAWLDTYWYDGVDDLYYYGYDGSVNISKSGNTYTLTFDGNVYDYQDPTAVRTDGCIGAYNNVGIAGAFKATFTPISQEVWSAWD